MDSSALRSKPAAGWWRLLAGLLLVAAATLGLGFYLPLKESNQLLSAQLAAAQASAAQLSDSLQQSQAALQQTTGERDELRGFKDQVDSRRQRYPETASQFARDAKAPLAAMFSSQMMQARALNDGVAVDWQSSRLLNAKRETLSASGKQLLCPLAALGGESELSALTVRTFVSDSDGSEAASPALGLAVGVADELVSRCKLSRAAVSVASSPATKHSPALSLEFRTATTTHAGM